MAVEKLNQIYRCPICGNIVEVCHIGGGTLVCCGKPMEHLIEKTKDQGMEKHVPIIEKDKEGIIVKIGQISHPMEEKHYIEFIEIITDKGISRKYLKAGDKPEAKFPIKNAEHVVARAYCNIHFLWKS